MDVSSLLNYPSSPHRSLSAALLNGAVPSHHQQTGPSPRALRQLNREKSKAGITKPKQQTNSRPLAQNQSRPTNVPLKHQPSNSTNLKNVPDSRNRYGSVSHQPLPINQSKRPLPLTHENLKLAGLHRTKPTSTRSFRAPRPHNSNKENISPNTGPIPVDLVKLQQALAHLHSLPQPIPQAPKQRIPFAPINPSPLSQSANNNNASNIRPQAYQPPQSTRNPHHTAYINKSNLRTLRVELANKQLNLANYRRYEEKEKKNASRKRKLKQVEEAKRQVEDRLAYKETYEIPILQFRVHELEKERDALRTQIESTRSNEMEVDRETPRVTELEKERDALKTELEISLAEESNQRCLAQLERAKRERVERERDDLQRTVQSLNGNARPTDPNFWFRLDQFRKEQEDSRKKLGLQEEGLQEAAQRLMKLAEGLSGLGEKGRRIVEELATTQVLLLERESQSLKAEERLVRAWDEAHLDNIS